ncbi:MAG: rod shape-determining protein RodA, partial [Rubrimonas sp.]
MTVGLRGMGLGAKLLRLNWAIVLLTCSVACIGFLMLYSVAGGRLDPWAGRQMARFGFGLVVMLGVALTHLRLWRLAAAPIYAVSFALLVAVEFVGTTGMGAQRWIDIGFMQLQPSELMKVALVLALAAYYAWLPPEKVSRPLWLIPPLAMTLAPTALTLIQPDLGTAVLLLAGGGVVMFLAGVHWLYFTVAAGAGAGVVWAVMASRGTPWQVLRDYQYRRIETFLDPSTDPLGAGYHITQSKIALGSGGLSGRGLMQGTQSRLNFLPEKQTDFIFTSLAEELGFIGAVALLTLYVLILLFCFVSLLMNRDRFGALLTGGVAATLFFYFAVNAAMVTGLMPVVGVPMPLVSYG